jgi:hypothetical protein
MNVLVFRREGCLSRSIGVCLILGVEPKVVDGVDVGINLACDNTIRNFLTGAKTTQSLIDKVRGYQLQSSEHDNRSLSALPIRYSPLSPSFPARF